MFRKSKYYPTECKPTVFPVSSFNPIADAIALRVALMGDPVVENVIIEVLGNRSFKQRMKIATEYNSSDENALINDFKSKLSGDFKYIVIALMTELTEYYASELYNGISERTQTVDMEVLIEILSTFSNYAIKSLNSNFEKMYGSRIIDKVSTTDNYFRNFVILLLDGCRSEDENVDHEQVKVDIAELNYYYESDDKNDWKAWLILILQMKSNEYLWELDYRHNLLDRIDVEFEYEFQDLFKIFIEGCTTKDIFLAGLLNELIDDLNDENKRNLSRIIVGRSEIDLYDIKKEYFEIFDTTLEAAFSSNDSHAKLLLTLIS